MEVDFILRRGEEIVAIEVKSASKRERLAGLEKFDEMFSPKRLLVVGEEGISIEEFLSTPVDQWI